MWDGKIRSKIVYGDWGENQPNGWLSEQCVSSFDDHYWHDVSCSDKYYFACETL